MELIDAYKNGFSVIEEFVDRDEIKSHALEVKSIIFCLTIFLAMLSVNKQQKISRLLQNEKTANVTIESLNQINMEQRTKIDTLQQEIQNQQQFLALKEAALDETIQVLFIILILY